MGQHLSLDREANFLKSVLNNECLKNNIKLSFSASPCSTSSLLSALSNTRTKVLHYSGHGHAGFLTAEDRTGNCERIDVNELTRVLDISDASNLKLVFVGACQSEVRVKEARRLKGRDAYDNVRTYISLYQH